jgi:hypothetical protein
MLELVILAEQKSSKMIELLAEQRRDNPFLKDRVNPEHPNSNCLPIQKRCPVRSKRLMRNSKHLLVKKFARPAVQTAAAAGDQPAATHLV